MVHSQFIEVNSFEFSIISELLTQSPRPYPGPRPTPPSRNLTSNLNPRQVVQSKSEMFASTGVLDVYAACVSRKFSCQREN